MRKKEEHETGRLELFYQTCLLVTAMRVSCERRGTDV